jgi:Protein of unknown function (DUF2806)
MGIEDLVPGKDLEKAAAGLATDAGKSLIRGIGRTLGAATAEWAARKEAKAEAARKSIDTQADIDRANALQTARRTQEIEEVEHQNRVELAKRRADRMVREMAREQKNLESIAAESLKLIEHDANAASARDLDEDWLFRFAEFAERVSDTDVQTLWAHVLKAASIEGRPKLSAASLLQLSLVDHDCAVAFEKFFQACQSFRGYPAHERSYTANSLHIDLMRLVELGLIKESSVDQFELPDFRLEMANQLPSSRRISMFHTVFLFTQRGAEIANAVFGGLSPSELLLSGIEEDAFLSELVGEMLRGYELVLVEPDRGRGYFIIHSKLGAVESPTDDEWARVLESCELSPRLRRLLDWAKGNYSVSVHQLQAH